jgi:2-oxoglutarate ferredoxin oxidoreductase subunit beta
MWCSGCGIGTMLGALLRAFEELGYTTTDTVVVTGIGCTGKADDYMITNALHTTHGRALAYATGVKAYNPKLNVVAIMGDGDGVTIGGNHFIHACRRNIDLTAIILNNLNFGMGANYVARCTPYHGWEMKENMKEALTKKGFSLVEVVSPCPTHFGRHNEMKETPDMLHWLRDRAIAVEEFRRLPEAERAERLAIGTLVSRDFPDFNTQYELVKSRAQKG